MKIVWYILHLIFGCGDDLREFKRGLFRCEKCGREYFDFRRF